ncbi:MAG: hypothetical protein Kow00114_30620 [Kiloniellaceae bacterium]
MTPERRKLLADCAALARGLAAEGCWRDASGGGCAWYHGFWPYMRLLDYGSSPELHRAFYVEDLAPLAAAATSARVLISGAADFAMLEVAREAFADAAAPPRFTVVDRCDTPLALCRWYAEGAGFAIETRSSDILRFEDAQGFDAIVTHSFLGSFPPELRAPLVARWFALLRPGGRLLTINRIRGEQTAASVPFSADESAAFIARLTRDLERHRDLLDAPPADIAALAEAYLGAKRSYPVRSREELAALFEDAGFSLDDFSELAAADPGEARPSGPTMPGNATYMKVVARRPA